MQGPSPAFDDIAVAAPRAQAGVIVRGDACGVKDDIAAEQVETGSRIIGRDGNALALEYAQHITALLQFHPISFRTHSHDLAPNSACLRLRQPAGFTPAHLRRQCARQYKPDHSSGRH
jgi:hypothetical protein